MEADVSGRGTAFHDRTLGHTEFPVVYLDAIYVQVRDDALGQVVSRSIVVTTGVTAQGGREVLGVDAGDSEVEMFWTAFLRSHKACGLCGVRLVISEASIAKLDTPSDTDPAATVELEPGN